MKRRNEPLVQKKPWEEMTEEERQVVRESWKYTLPEKFDVFCIGDFQLKDPIFIPGNFYVSGDISETRIATSILTSENFFVEGSINVGPVFVGGNHIVGHIDSCTYISIIGDFICDNDINAQDIIVGGNFIVDGNVDSGAIDVHKIFDCHDVNSWGYKIHATDYVCRCFKEKN